MTVADIVPYTGSSPRVWGQDSYTVKGWQDTGIIPTRVGTSNLYDKMAQSTEDHPHACGDKRKRLRGSCACRGSSPRVWGQAEQYTLIGGAGWIIPTRVGTSLGHIKLIDSFGDHPHACGDKHRKGE